MERARKLPVDLYLDATFTYGIYGMVLFQNFHFSMTMAQDV